MDQSKNKHTIDADTFGLVGDDQTVLNFLLQHVRGLKPVSDPDDTEFSGDISYS